VRRENKKKPAVRKRGKGTLELQAPKGTREGLLGRSVVGSLGTLRTARKGLRVLGYKGGEKKKGGHTKERTPPPTKQSSSG